MSATAGVPRAIGPASSSRETPDVSVIVPTWNGRALLAECLPAIDALQYPREHLEVIVFDNGSRDDTVGWLRVTWPAVRVVESAVNVGFAAACDRAADVAHGTVLAFLNNDLRVEPRWLGRMTDALAESGAAAAGSRILDWEGARYDFDGGTMNFYGHGAVPRHGRAVRAAGDEPARPTLFACGAAMVAERTAFLASGGFDPDYFAYFEDVDLGWRLWMEGQRVLFVPDAVAYHRHHGSRLDEAHRTALLERNALATVFKNYDDANLGRVLPAALLLLTVRARLAGGARGALYHDTLARFLDGLPALRRKRDAVQARRRRPDREILPLFGEPMRPSFFGRAYWREQVRVARAFGIAAALGVTDETGMNDFIEELEGRIEELEAERARLAAEVERLRDELARRAGTKGDA